MDDGYRKTYYSKLRDAAIIKLGGKCTKCGYIDVRALQIDHIHGGGTEEVHRIGHQEIFRRILAGEEGYQILCANCNWIKRDERKEFANSVNKEQARMIERMGWEKLAETSQVIKHGETLKCLTCGSAEGCKLISILLKKENMKLVRFLCKGCNKVSYYKTPFDALG
mgnify:CR=1 FL=1